LGQVKRWEMGENGELRLWYAEGQALRLLAE
jgi:heat shock protein HslJ